MEILNNPPEHRVELGPHPVSARSAVVDATGLNRFLQPDRRVPLQGVIAELAAQETRGIQDPLAKARAIYNSVIATMRTTSPAPAGATAMQYGLAPPSVATARIFTGCLSA